MKFPQYTNWRHYSAQQTDFFLLWSGAVLLMDFSNFSERLKGNPCSQPLSHFAAFSLLYKTADRAWEDAPSVQAITSSISLDFKQFSHMSELFPPYFWFLWEGFQQLLVATSVEVTKLKKSFLSFSMPKNKDHVQTMSTVAKHTDQHFYKGFMGFWHAGWIGSGFLLSLWTHV